MQHPKPDLTTIKERQQLAWASGDYSMFGAALLIMSELLCEAVDLRPGQMVLDVATGSGTVDAYWEWLAGELARGELRALLELAMQHEPGVRAAADAVALARARGATRTVEQLFAGLGLTPRMPAALLGGASVAFVDGLAVGAASPGREPRVSFDLFWLALLSLAE